MGAVFGAGILGVTMPGAVGLGALTGWAVGRLGRHRLPIAFALAAAATVANAALSGFIDWAAGDPAGVIAHGPLDGAVTGLLGVAILWWALAPLALVVGGVLTLVTWPARAAARPASPIRA